MPNASPYIPKPSTAAADNFFECATMQMSPAQLFGRSPRPGSSRLSAPKGPPPLPTYGRQAPTFPAIGTEYELSLLRPQDNETTTPNSHPGSFSEPTVAPTASGESYAPVPDEERTMQVEVTELDITDTTSIAADSTLASPQQLASPPVPSFAGHRTNRLRTFLQFAMLLLVVEALVGLTIHLYVTLTPSSQEQHLTAPQMTPAPPTLEEPASLVSSPVSVMRMK
jgi:hypothetical protein